MRPNYCLITLHVLILVALPHTLEADSEDSQCEVEIRVRRNTVYEGLLGKELRINCTVQFCNNSPPAVSWHKMEKTYVRLDTSSNSRIKTEWKRLNHLEGALYLIFQNTLRSDSGEYRCQSGGSVSHAINVIVHGDDEPTPATSEHKPVTSQHTSVISVQQCPAIQDYVWPYVYRAAGIIAFLIVVVTMIRVVSKYGCKGARCGGESRDTPDLSRQPSSHALPTTHIYENDQ